MEWLKEALALGLGFVLLAKGAHALVDGGAALARRWDVSPLIVGLTVVAWGTSLPEVVVSAIASYDGEAGMARGQWPRAWQQRWRAHRTRRSRVVVRGGRVLVDIVRPHRVQLAPRSHTMPRTTHARARELLRTTMAWTDQHAPTTAGHENKLAHRRTLALACSTRMHRPSREACAKAVGGVPAHPRSCCKPAHVASVRLGFEKSRWCV